MNKYNATHRMTKFDVACEEKNEYDKTYGNDLSYGYYSAYKKTGKLPESWYEHLIGLKRSVPINFDKAALEHQEYKRRFHKKISFNDYIKKRDNGTLREVKWYLFLIRCETIIPSDFKAAYAEYIEYNISMHDTLTFFEYYEKLADNELPDEWYRFLIYFEKIVSELEEESF